MKVAMCAIVKNEERDVLEWLLFHAAIGFDTIVLYDNGSEDRTFEIAERAKQFIDLRLISWPEKFSQRSVYKDCYTNFDREFDWICFLDSDEFIVPIRDRGIKAYLQAMDEHSAIAVNWVTYGSSGKTQFPEGLIVDNFLYRAELSFSNNRHVKSILRPHVPLSVKNPHYFNLTPGNAYVDVNGQACQWLKEGKLLRPIGQDVIRIHHYFTKSSAHYRIKLARGNADSGTRIDQFDHNDRNEMFDPVIPQLFEKELRIVRGQIRAILE